MIVITELEAATRTAIAGLIGLGVGLEREWSGHTAGENARFAGLRTFFLLGLLGGTAGLLLAQSHEAVAATLSAGGMALAVGAYVMAVRRPNAKTDGTTEAAALAVIGLTVLAGIGWLTLAVGAGSLMVLALSEKARLHWLVQRVGETELRATLQFAVLALVVLPLLPVGPLFGPLAVRPRALWVIVLLLSGLNFAGFLARKAVGQQRGYGITGALGGIISSTVVTLTFSRKSRHTPELSQSLASGVIAACTVLIPRVLIVSAVLNVAVSLALAPLLLAPFIAGVAIIALHWRHNSMDAATSQSIETSNPLRIGAAIKMAMAFQIGIVLIGVVRGAWGNTGLFATAAFLGLTDMDALTVSMSRLESGIAPAVAAHALAIGILANTMLKLGLALSLGTPRYRRLAATGLAGLAAASLIGLWLA